MSSIPTGAADAMNAALGSITFSGAQPQVPSATPQPQAAPVEAPKAPDINVSSANSAAQNAVKEFELINFDDEPTSESKVETPEEPKLEDLEGNKEESLEAVDDDSDLPDTPAAENFKKLRTAIKAERLAKAQLKEELAEKASRLEKYEKGEIMPEVLQAKDSRISELEKYEKIVQVKLSPEYQEAVVSRSIPLKQKLEAIGADYGIAPEEMHKLVGITNRKDRDMILSKNFSSVTGLELNNIINELHEIGELAIEIEKQPQEVMQRLQAEYIEKQNEIKRQRAVVFESTAKTAWSDALDQTAQEDAFKQLVKHPTDSEYNKKVVEPIQAKASQQFGALVAKLAKAGLTELEPGFAKNLARMCLLSVGGAMTLRDMQNAVKQAEQIKQSAKRDQAFYRPSMSGTAGQTLAPSSSGPTSFKDAASSAKIAGT